MYEKEDFGSDAGGEANPNEDGWGDDDDGADEDGWGDNDGDNDNNDANDDPNIEIENCFYEAEGNIKDDP